jgi:DNA replication and repair protein RecF
MITDIRLQNFRSYNDSAYELGAGVNIIVGPNASGKTNLLEAIQIICLGSSYRAKDRELIKFNKPWARLDANTKVGQRVVKLETIGESVKKGFSIDSQDFLRLPFQKTLPVVLFEPEHLQLLRGSPELRRSYLDDTLEQTTPGYKKLRHQYARTLAQRNALLKKGSVAAKPQIFVWDLRLSEFAEQVVTARLGLIEALNDQIGVIYCKLSGSRKKVKITYEGVNKSQGYATRLLHKLEENIDDDLMRGFTRSGPHRDDMTLFIDEHNAQESASRGEVRTLLLALKILELKLIEKERGQKPLLLLDDVFSELDGKRRQALTKFLEDYQTFITTTDADVVVQHFMNSCTIIPTG